MVRVAPDPPVGSSSVDQVGAACPPAGVPPQRTEGAAGFVAQEFVVEGGLVVGWTVVDFAVGCSAAVVVVAAVESWQRPQGLL